MKKYSFNRAAVYALFVIIIAVLAIPGCGNTTETPPSPTVSPTSAPQPPVIKSLTAPQQAEALSISPIQLVAVGSDNLTYQWFASKGTIIGIGNNISWKAPDEAGDFTIKAVVANSKGEEATKSVTVTVTPRPLKAPVVKSFTVTRTGQQPVTIPANSTETITIAKFRPAIIVCNAEDPEGGTLSYLWYAPFGTVEGGNNTIKWVTAQDSNKQGDCVLTVTVISSKGARTKASLVIHVPCCAD